MHPHKRIFYVAASIRVILFRTLMVLAAIFLVIAFTLVTVMPPFTSLAELIANTDHAALVWAKDFADHNLPAWLWLNIVVPVLLRPCWLPPLAAGLVFLGLSVTLRGRGKGVARTRRRS
jgi:hypothetical protein